jgi:hypothetical protein
MSKHNDEERRQWVENDEGLYDLMRSSRQSQRAFIRENRALIDRCIDDVLNGSKPAHYLKYGG